MASPKTIFKFKGQNYEELKRQTSPFTDDEFNANDASIGIAEDRFKGVHWMRPKDICRSSTCLTGSPKFISQGMGKHDVMQQGLGDCWFVAAAASLTLHPKLLKWVVPEHQTFDNNPGIFYFRFWQSEQWVEVVVDDQLPTTKNGELLFAKSSKNGDFWMPLLEKAYAKLRGSYGALVGGHASNAFTALTGVNGKIIHVNKHQEDLNQTIQNALKRNSLMAASIEFTKDKTKLEQLKGLQMNHAYSITAIENLTVEGKKMTLLRLRNPWGHTEWNGAWNDDDSQRWSKVDPEQKKKLLVKKNEGEFWMNVDDFLKIFHQLHICHISDEGTF
ncbi:UNVERIFIED_CONTAM: hypothetical protein K2H54_033879 [Gekko kuhli]